MKAVIIVTVPFTVIGKFYFMTCLVDYYFIPEPYINISASKFYTK